MDRISLPKKLSERMAAHKKGVPAKKEQYLHSESHQLADELSSKFGEPKRFAMYLGLAKKYNHQFLRRIAGEVLEGTAKNPGALFTFLVKKQAQEQNNKNNTEQPKPQ